MNFDQRRNFGRARNPVAACPPINGQRIADFESKESRKRQGNPFPLTPSLSLGERENVRTLRQRSGNVGFDPTHRSSAPSQLNRRLHGRTPLRTWPFQTSRVVLPLPWGEGWGEGEGLDLSLTAFFLAVGSGLHSPKIARNLKR